MNFFYKGIYVKNPYLPLATHLKRKGKFENKSRKLLLETIMVMCSTYGKRHIVPEARCMKCQRRAVHVSEARMGLVNGLIARPTLSRNSNPRCSDVSRVITWASGADTNITQPASKGYVR